MEWEKQIIKQIKIQEEEIFNLKKEIAAIKKMIEKGIALNKNKIND